MEGGPLEAGVACKLSLKIFRSLLLPSGQKKVRQGPGTRYPDRYLDRSDTVTLTTLCSSSTAVASLCARRRALRGPCGNPAAVAAWREAHSLEDSFAQYCIEDNTV